MVVGEDDDDEGGGARDETAAEGEGKHLAARVRVVVREGCLNAATLTTTSQQSQPWAARPTAIEAASQMAS